MPPRKRGGNRRDMIDDLVMLDALKEDKILEALKKRYLNDSIYTNIGPVLVAINPFKRIAAYYGDDVLKSYKGKKYFEVIPHVYSVADDTYRTMISMRENQCVIISGESGAGKTETSKIFMSYISSATSNGSEVQRVKDRMLSSNPILEAFGNAKTVNNNNSSRFGKYMQIIFDFGGDPVGGLITTYLLEKSRVVSPGKTERNFHVFYLLCKAAAPQVKEQFYIQDMDYYSYLNQTGTYDVDGINDIEWMQEMVEAFNVIGFSPAEVNEIYRILSAVLWLGNVTFAQDNNEASSVEDQNVLTYVATLLEIDAKMLEKAMCTRTIETGYGRNKETFAKPQTAENAYFSRDTVAKALYSQCFEFIVAKVNESIAKPNYNGLQIGVLDIYGFEIFEQNGFEQLCINFVNEKLQQVFIDLTLKSEQDEYRAEGIPWKEIKYQNNKPICEFIENKPGLLSLCDDCCNTNKTDQMFLGDLGNRFNSTGIVNCGSKDFVIKHFAGTVRYMAKGFLIKNQDTLFDDLKEAIKSSPLPFVQYMGWADMKTASGQRRRPISVGSAFRKQVGLLMKELRSCTPHYIRCIKPNVTKKPNDWDKKQSLRQVRYLGLLENVKVRRAGYAYRSEYTRFSARYKLLSDDAWTGKFRGSPRDLSVHLCQQLGWAENQEFALGKTKIFISESKSLFFIEEMLERKMDEAVVSIQKAYRAFSQKRAFLQTRADAYDLVKGQKERRRGSIERDYKGDYCDFSYNKQVRDLVQGEKIVFSDRAKHGILQSKKSALSRFFKKDTASIVEPRFALITDKALYSFRFGLAEEEKGAPVGQWRDTVTNVFYKAEFHEIESITASSLADDWLIIHFSGQTRKDVLCRIRRKTEFLTLLKQMKPSITIIFKNQDTICVNFKKKKMVSVTWLSSPSIGKQALFEKKKELFFNIHCPSGVAQMNVPEPFRPGQGHPAPSSNSNRGGGFAAPSARGGGGGGGGQPKTRLRALYDFQGGAPDQLSFKAGDVLDLVKPDEDGGWFDAEFKGKKGLCPASFVEKFTEKPKPVARVMPTPRPVAAVQPVNRSGGVNSYRPGGKYAPAPVMRKAAPPVKKVCVWEKIKDPASGDFYYSNSKTQESTWDKPADYFE